VYKDADGTPDLETMRRAITTTEICPTCDGFLRHHIREENKLGRAYNFWACSNRECRTTMEDLNGLPNFNKVNGGTQSEHTCPDCGKYLTHMYKEESNEDKGFNYWKCPDAACGTFFDDEDGAPNHNTIRKSILSSFPCPKCQSPLKHNLRDPGTTTKGYNYWVCSNKDCGTNFEDSFSSPGPERKKTQFIPSDYKCPDCERPLNHIVKESDSTSQGFNFWGCSGYPECRATFADDNGKPGAKNSSSVKPEPSGFKCPRCQSDLVHRKGFSSKTGNDYDFFVCPNPDCRSTYNNKNGEPFIPENVKRQQQENL
jgi:ssDNA-binding Zn-finger/Zn-ribbon topoisomerase 1